MAKKVIWTAQALNDIDAIAEFISRDSPHHAQRVVDTFLRLSHSAAMEPMIGRMVPELGNIQIRERFLYSYRFIYQLQVESIAILAVFHGRRSLASIGSRFE